GIVLVDASHPEQFERYPPDVSRAREALESASLPPRFVQQFLAATGAYRLLILPPPQNAITAFLPRTVPSGFSGELAAREAITAQASAATTLGDMPLIVLSAGRTPALPGVSDSALGELAAVHAELQAELAALSSNSQLRTCPDAGHNIQMDDPDAVVAAVSEVVNAVRGPRKLVESRDSAVDSPRAMGDDYDRLSTVNC